MRRAGFEITYQSTNIFFCFVGGGLCSRDDLLPVGGVRQSVSNSVYGSVTLDADLADSYEDLRKMKTLEKTYTYQDNLPKIIDVGIDLCHKLILSNG